VEVGKPSDSSTLSLPWDVDAMHLNDVTVLLKQNLEIEKLELGCSLSPKR
jgi:hypothetical protein